ncbi:csbD-like domain-containing protein [Rutstroemia sp. NJR-2017a WRK4]|nr:csbD-like domain-containing protein [Rutstroemia sp. NJR-2017a WRK4]
MSAPNSEQPSMLAGHAQYVKGYVAETIGSVTGSKEWTESGKQNEQAGIATMKAANANKTSEPAPTSIGGKIEELAGKATGCEGMVGEGKERQEKAA